MTKDWTQAPRTTQELGEFMAVVLAKFNEFRQAAKQPSVAARAFSLEDCRTWSCILLERQPNIASILPLFNQAEIASEFDRLTVESKATQEFVWRFSRSAKELDKNPSPTALADDLWADYWKSLSEKLSVNGVNHMPFRPYKRFKSQVMDIAESHNFMIKSCLESQADEHELQGIGGSRAVLESIQRHLPDFDPAQATTTYGPSWVKLKPILVRCGLSADETTTLTDIKGFLDASPIGLANKKEFDVPDNRQVFIVHGHNEEMKQAVARMLEKLSLVPIILHEQSSLGRTIIEKLCEYCDAASFAIVLLSPDDWAYPNGASPKEARTRARQNVILELGLFLGRLGRTHVSVLFREHEKFELPSDYSGVLFIPYDKLGHWRYRLAGELQAAGFPVDKNKLD